MLNFLFFSFFIRLFLAKNYDDFIVAKNIAGKSNEIIVKTYAKYANFIFKPHEMKDIEGKKLVPHSKCHRIHVLAF